MAFLLTFSLKVILEMLQQGNLFLEFLWVIGKSVSMNHLLFVLNFPINVIKVNSTGLKDDFG